MKTNRNSRQRRQPQQPQREEMIKENWSQSIDSFQNMNLKEELLRGIFASGFEKPSVLQQRAIVPCVKGDDVIAQSQSGSGKTAAGVISVLQRINVSRKETQAVVLAPTRELAQHIHKVVLSLGDYMGVCCYACVGGTDIRQTVEDLKSMRPHVIVGTPGRVSDMLTRKLISSRTIQTLVLDEAGRMVGQVFKEQLHKIFSKLPTKVQVVVLSSTTPTDVLEVTKSSVREPKNILVKKDEVTLEETLQFYVNTEQEESKMDALCGLFETLAVTRSVIFVNSRRRAERLAERLTAEDFTVHVLHGEMEQSDRNLVLKEFLSGSNRVLISTDRLVGGIHLQQVSLVINYDLPTNFESYIRRVGRDAGFGRKMVAVSMVTKENQRTLLGIQKFCSSTIKELPSNVDQLL